MTDAVGKIHPVPEGPPFSMLCEGPEGAFMLERLT